MTLFRFELADIGLNVTAESTLIDLTNHLAFLIQSDIKENTKYICVQNVHNIVTKTIDNYIYIVLICPRKGSVGQKLLHGHSHHVCRHYAAECHAHREQQELCDIAAEREEHQGL